MSGLATWLPAVVWTAVVLAMSSAPFSADNTVGVLHPLLAWLLPWLRPEDVDRIHFVVRKAGHLTEYAILAALWFRGFTRSGAGRRAAAPWLALAIALTCAVIDESHQATVATRTGALGDVVIDTVGALAAVVAAHLGWWRTTTVATGALLWIATVGGLAALALDLASGAGGGVLWATVPIAAGALLYRWRKRASSS